MTWVKLCGVDDVPPDSMAMFSVDGVDVLVVRSGETWFALPPLCPYMREPLRSGSYTACFDGAKPACNKYWRRSPGQTAEPAGVSSGASERYVTRKEGAEIYVDTSTRVPLLEFEHVTCSPVRTGAGKACLLLDLWERGSANRRRRVRADGPLPASTEGA